MGIENIDVTFSSQFIQVFEHICDKFGVVIDWGSKNVVPYVMDLCGRFISYSIIKNIFSIVVFVGAFFITWKLTKSLCSKENKWDSDFTTIHCLNISFVFGWLGRITFTITGLIFCSSWVLNIFKCIYIPEAVILNYLNGLM